MLDTELLQEANTFLTKTKEGKKLLQEAKGKGGVKSAVPKLKTYTISGLIVDSLSSDPLGGVDITIIGGIMKTKSPKTKADGTYEIKVKLPVLPIKDDAVIIRPQLFFTKDEFVPALATPITEDRQVRGTLQTLQMLNINKASEGEVDELNFKINNQISKLESLTLDGIDKIANIRGKQVRKLINIAQNTLLPAAISILIIFGITKLSQASQAKCPNNILVRQAISRRNKVVRQLNNIYKAIALNAALAAVFNFTAIQLRSIKITIESLPIPLISQTYSTTKVLDIIREVIKEFIDQNKKLNKQTIIALVLLIVTLAIILLIFKKIDELIERCSTDNPELENIDGELLLLQETSQEPTLTIVNGFTMDIEVDEKNKVGSLIRRYAVAKNSKGIVILRGESSFSATTQILIDELAFYITSNNLKAD